MTLYAGGVPPGAAGFQSVLSALGGMYEDTLYMSNLFEYLAIPTDAPKAPAPLAAVRAEEGIRFEDVGFRYPGGETKLGAARRRTSSSRRGRAWRSSARTAPARRRSSSC